MQSYYYLARTGPWNLSLVTLFCPSSQRLFVLKQNSWIRVALPWAVKLPGLYCKSSWVPGVLLMILLGSLGWFDPLGSLDLETVYRLAPGSAGSLTEKEWTDFQVGPEMCPSHGCPSWLYLPAQFFRYDNDHAVILWNSFSSKAKEINRKFTSVEGNGGWLSSSATAVPDRSFFAPIPHFPLLIGFREHFKNPIKRGNRIDRGLANETCSKWASCHLEAGKKCTGNLPKPPSGRTQCYFFPKPVMSKGWGGGDEKLGGNTVRTSALFKCLWKGSTLFKAEASMMDAGTSHMLIISWVGTLDQSLNPLIVNSLFRWNRSHLFGI